MVDCEGLVAKYFPHAEEVLDHADVERVAKESRSRFESLVRAVVRAAPGVDANPTPTGGSNPGEQA